jgi:phosphatidylinositol phosphate synthase
MLSSLKKTIEKPLIPFIGVLEHVPPNVLTLLGVVPSLFFFFCILSHAYGWALIAMIGNFFDFFDGMVARKYHKVTTFGGFFDSLLDRVADFFIITSFGFVGLVNWGLVLGVLLCAFLTSYIRSRAELASSGKVSFAVGIIERPERLIGIALTLLLFALFPSVQFSGMNILTIGFWILFLLSGYTVLQRVMYAYKKL